MDLSHLNKEQIKAVTAPIGPICVLAGAGTGKTRVLTNRIAYLIDDLQVDASSILAMTFTKKAADEMQERVSLLSTKQTPQISTIHSFCLNLLSKEVLKCKYLRPNFKIAAAFDSKVILSKALSNRHIPSKDFNTAHFFKYMSEQKSKKKMPDDADISLAMFKEIYRDFQAEVIARNLLTFDDMILYTAFLLEDADIKLKYQNIYQHVLVDEYQDTSPLQFEIIYALTENSRNIYVVGDNDQSIYGFRGADMRIILDFNKTFPEAEIIKLELNYRCAPSIVNAANALIKHNINRFDKKLIATSTSTSKVHAKETYHLANSAEYVTNHVLHYTKDLNDVAVLIRNTSLSACIEEAFSKYSVPYEIVGAFPFFEREEIKDVVAFMELYYDSSNTDAFLRIVNKPSRFIGKATASAVADYCKDKGINVSTALARHLDCIDMKPSQKRALRDFASLFSSFPKDLEDMMKYIMKIMGYETYLKNITDEEQRKDKIENIITLDKIIGKFIEDKKGGVKEFISYCYYMRTHKEDQQGVKVMTIHKAKGLEFETVFVVGAVEGILPSSYAIEEEKNHSDRLMEEERRLFYVAITRAKNGLHVLAHEKSDDNKNLIPSRFLYESGMLQKPKPEPEKQELKNDIVELTPQQLNKMKIIQIPISKQQKIKFLK